MELNKNFTETIELEVLKGYLNNPKNFTKYSINGQDFSNKVYKQTIESFKQYTDNGKLEKDYKMLVEVDNHEEVRELIANLNNPSCECFYDKYATLLKLGYLRKLIKNGINVSKYYDEKDVTGECFNNFNKTTLTEMQKYFSDDNKVKIALIHEDFGGLPIYTHENMPKRPNRDVIIEDMMLDHSLNMIVAPPKRGKSFYGLEMAYAITNGGEFFKRSCNQCDTLVADWEYDINDIDKRMSDIEAYGNYKKSPYIMPFTDLQDRNIPTLEETLRQAEMFKHYTPTLKVLFLDCWYRFFMDNENDSGDCRRYLDAMKQFTNDTGCTIVFMHHTGKGYNDICDEEADTSGAPRGSSAIPAYCDQLYHIMATKKNLDIGLVKNFGRNFNWCDGFARNPINGIMDWRNKNIAGNPFTALTEKEKELKEIVIQAYKDGTDSRTVLKTEGIDKDFLKKIGYKTNAKHKIVEM